MSRTMTTAPYSFAELNPDEVERLRDLEEQLSSSSGSPVTLIAYAPPSEDAADKRASDG